MGARVACRYTVHAGRHTIPGCGALTRRSPSSHRPSFGFRHLAVDVEYALVTKLLISVDVLLQLKLPLK